MWDKREIAQYELEITEREQRYAALRRYLDDPLFGIVGASVTSDATGGIVPNRLRGANAYIRRLAKSGGGTIAKHRGGHTPKKPRNTKGRK